MSQPTPPRLLSLGDVPPRRGVELRPELEAVKLWADSSSGRPGLWVHGPRGSGRTTAIAEALRRSTLPHAVRRVACFPGMSLEEVLEHAAQLFRQTGDEGLAGVLRQRAHVRSKVFVLLEVLRTRQLSLWIDDADLLHGAPGSLDVVLASAGRMQGALGRLIITTTSPPPSGHETVFEVISTSWTGSVLERWVSSRAPGASGPEAIEQAVSQSRRSLSPPANAALEAISTLPPGTTRQVFREVLAVVGIELDLRTPAAEPLLLELEDAGLVDLAVPRGEDDVVTGPPLSIPEPVRAALERALKERDGVRWKRLVAVQGANALRLASRTADLWSFVQAWRAYFAAGELETAHELQKAFVEELIQHGSIDAARHVLEETVRVSTGTRRTVALGNLAIIYKNTGEPRRALEAYGEVRDHLLRSGNIPNLARVLHQIGNTHYVLTDYHAALESYRHSLEASSEAGERHVAAATRIQIANVHFVLGERQTALGEYLATLEESRALGDQSLECAVALQLGQMYLEDGQSIEAEAHLGQADAAARSLGDLRSLVKIHEALGRLARDRREYVVARSRFDAAHGFAVALGDAGEIVSSLIHIGDLEKDRLHLVEALSAYRGAEQIARELGQQAPAEAEAIVRPVRERVRRLAEEMGELAFLRLEGTLEGKLQAP